MCVRVGQQVSVWVDHRLFIRVQAWTGLLRDRAIESSDRYCRTDGPVDRIKARSVNLMVRIELQPNYCRFGEFL